MVVIWSVWRVALPGGVQELTGTSRTTMCNCRGLKAPTHNLFNFDFTASTAPDGEKVGERLEKEEEKEG